MKKISTVLRETDVHQIRGHLVMFDDLGNMEGKCALGVLSCETGIPAMQLVEHGLRPMLRDILAAYGIPDEEQIGYPNIGYKYQDNIKPGETYAYEMTDLDFNRMHSISDQIITLNDCFGYTFKQIADFLETTYDL